MSVTLGPTPDILCMQDWVEVDHTAESKSHYVINIEERLDAADRVINEQKQKIDALNSELGKFYEAFYEAEKEFPRLIGAIDSLESTLEEYEPRGVDEEESLSRADREVLNSLKEGTAMRQFHISRILNCIMATKALTDAKSRFTKQSKYILDLQRMVEDEQTENIANQAVIARKAREISGAQKHIAELYEKLGASQEQVKEGNISKLDQERDRQQAVIETQEAKICLQEDKIEEQRVAIEKMARQLATADAKRSSPMKDIAQRAEHCMSQIEAGWSKLFSDMST